VHPSRLAGGRRPLQRAAGLVGCHRRRRARTTIADPTAAPAPNLVAHDFAAPALSRLWLGDSTYVPRWAGGRYLAGRLDAHSRRVIGWAMAEHLRAELAREVLQMALASRRPAAGPIHHTAWGCQSTADAYRAALAVHPGTASMSRTGDCDDNAMAERSFATRKAERIETRPWPTRRAARQAIFAWRAVCYNRRRFHPALGYRRPATDEMARAREA